ncbi:MAG: UDP-N-acetylmuramoyl-L-alanyl-D-glutamate--2,6-diaminopimelate ligase [Bacilli bacterium]
MKLKKLLNNIEYKLIKGSLDTNVTDLCYDSRKVKEGSAFICLSGTQSDGHNFIESAIEKGATSIFIEKDIEVSQPVTVIKLSNTRKNLSLLAINYFDNPSSKLTMIGITGTKGKTTTSWMIKNILEEDGKKVGVIGTMGVFIENNHYETINTTPESYEIQKYLREMVNQNIEYAVMEVSSQALKVGRVEGMTFDYGIFTNLTEDHIGKGEHENMEDYIHSKSLLFKICKHGILNIDDSNYQNMIKNSVCDVYTYGKNKNANLQIKDIKLLRKEDFVGLELHTKGLIEDTFLVNTPGEFSAYNAASAILTTKLIGCKLESIKRALSKVAVKGRVEIIPVSSKYSVIIDYAHNGISMINILKTMRQYHPKRIVSLFGCGGNRSKTRRYDMGEISGRLSDFTIITEDNSRYEDINDIMNDIEIGLKKANGKYIKIEDRKEAIKYAIENAKEGDIILLLGKGHETYREKNGVREHFDEREVIKEIINNK